MPPQQQDSMEAASSSVQTDVCMSTENDGSVDILVEIVGANRLVVDDNDDFNEKHLRAHCVVSFGGCEIHKTRSAERGCNPIWTIDTKSLFVLSATPAEMNAHSLTIQLWTKRHDPRLPNLMAAEKLFLGQITLGSEKILAHCNEERFEVELEDELGQETGSLGTLALRMRVATKSDINFVKSWNRAQENRGKVDLAVKALIEEEQTSVRPIATLVTETNETQIAGASFLNALSSAFQVKSYREHSTGQQKIRVKPHADPKRPKETAYMTSHDISIETRRPSQNWVEAGSGTLGNLYVEILSCHGLPNVDSGEAIGNLTDPFVCAVFEDTMVQTPVIDDELSPHWLPWTQRAFCFGIMHPASMLYLGVFDYDLGPLVDHEAIGRVAVNISNLQRDTQYVLKYNLYKSSSVTDRTPNGSITIRLRYEVCDEKVALMTALRPRPRVHVNVTSKKTFKVVRYTCFGEFDNEEKFDMTVFKSYINEIFEYKRHMGYAISDALGSLIFWRGQIEIYGVLLPVYSTFFFCLSIYVIERPYMFPSFLLLSVAGVMLANMRNRLAHPSPWTTCPSFWHFASILWTGHSNISVLRINAKEKFEEQEAYDKAWQKRVEGDLKAAAKKAEMQTELNAIGDETIHTELKGGITMELLDRLAYYQGYGRMVCRFFRYIKIILLWEESIVSFWVTAVFVVSGLISLLLPWAFMLTWTSRIVVWGFFGPHMKIVDLYLRVNAKDRFKTIVEQFEQKHQAARTRREDAVKLKAFKCLRFGEYITQVPEFNLARHYDRPLPESTCRYIRKGTPVMDKNAAWIPGQQLYGAMIPRPEQPHELNKSYIEKEQDRLKQFKTRMIALKAAVKLHGKLTRHHRVLRLRNHVDEDEPVSAGYELVQWRGKTLAEMVPTHMEWSTPSLPVADFNSEGMDLCVFPCQESAEEEKKDGAQGSSIYMLVTEEKSPSDVKPVTDNDTASTDDSMPEYSGSQEEGIEVVAWGRFSPMTPGHHLFRDEKVEEVHHPGKDKRHGGGSLSLLIRESDSTYVAYFRP
jgi:hypothetical protein